MQGINQTITAVLKEFIWNREPHILLSNFMTKLNGHLPGHLQFWSDYQLYQYIHDHLSLHCTYEQEGPALSIPYELIVELFDSEYMTHGSTERQTVLATALLQGFRANLGMSIQEGIDPIPDTSLCFNTFALRVTASQALPTFDDPIFH